ncbi:NUDIX domain-containing protein [Leadbetterella byssophila]|uniref:NUDIX domain-containing protein n=1 Tax=Leadbetterella byssophila TaxID=316068 RepID=UPI0002D550AC|nr:NUDIX domain-containing protein [Leadbetterella byssophila]
MVYPQKGHLHHPKEGVESVESREVYDRGNGAVILLYNFTHVILTRLPTFIKGNSSGMLIEACGGILDKSDPETAIRRETEVETGYKVDKIQKIFQAYMSPGSVTEILHFYIAEYSSQMKKGEGGGLEEEGENIEISIPKTL